MAPAPRQPGLFEADAPPPAKTGRLQALAPAPLAVSRSGPRLWLALHFPTLPLAALGAGSDRPRAVVEQAGRQSRIQLCDPVASRYGVRAGLLASAALALLPELELLARNRRREQGLLTEFATLALRFTPCVSLAGPATLLLEIGGSLRLFGTAGQLRERVLATLGECGPAAGTAIAPTARAARWLAVADTGAQVPGRAHLAGQLGRLRIAQLPWPAARRRSLEEMGVVTLADCVRLPRPGLARRFGAALLEELDQAYGRRPEALAWYHPEPHFSDRLELEQESVDGQALGAALDSLIARLAEQLRLRQRSVHRVWLQCEHRDQPATRIRIGLLQATAAADRLQELGRVQLAAAQLPAAVLAVSLQAVLEPAPVPQAADLLDSGEAVVEDALAFIERLRARLGEAAVHGLQTRAEHRPELAWQAVREPPVATGNGRPDTRLAGQRPLWMLPVPVRLQENRGQPVFRGPLQLACGPERIETGWWDGGDIRRDYYVAQNHHGVRLWIYRDLRESRWYLHGLFG